MCPPDGYCDDFERRDLPGGKWTATESLSAKFMIEAKRRSDEPVMCGRRLTIAIGTPKNKEYVRFLTHTFAYPNGTTTMSLSFDVFYDIAATDAATDFGLFAAVSLERFGFDTRHIALGFDGTSGWLRLHQGNGDAAADEVQKLPLNPRFVHRVELTLAKEGGYSAQVDGKGEVTGHVSTGFDAPLHVAVGLASPRQTEVSTSVWMDNVVIAWR
ncbi:MAG: hypothetical protein KIT84_02365 [Labilithrix sp.]|nr:hypothetical protein [Labilithrix sp.]MCW5809829.1 hypothetical protein [Labilithrix sp.]